MNITVKTPTQDVQLHNAIIVGVTEDFDIDNFKASAQVEFALMGSDDQALEHTATLFDAIKAGTAQRANALYVAQGQQDQTLVFLYGAVYDIDTGTAYSLGLDYMMLYKGLILQYLCPKCKKPAPKNLDRMLESAETTSVIRLGEMLAGILTGIAVLDTQSDEQFAFLSEYLDVPLISIPEQTRSLYQHYIVNRDNQFEPLTDKQVLSWPLRYSCTDICDLIDKIPSIYARGIAAIKEAM